MPERFGDVPGRPQYAVMAGAAEWELTFFDQEQMAHSSAASISPAAAGLFLLAFHRDAPGASSPPIQPLTVESIVPTGYAVWRVTQSHQSP